MAISWLLHLRQFPQEGAVTGVIPAERLLSAVTTVTTVTAVTNVTTVTTVTGVPGERLLAAVGKSP